MKLSTKKTWRAAKDGELRRGDEVLPTAVVYTYKAPSPEHPHGLYKARLVVLGNLEKFTPGVPLDVFAPTVSLPAVRYLVAWAAAHGMHIRQVDIT